MKRRSFLARLLGGAVAAPVAAAALASEQAPMIGIDRARPGSRDRTAVAVVKTPMGLRDYQEEALCERIEQRLFYVYDDPWQLSFDDLKMTARDIAAVVNRDVEGIVAHATDETVTFLVG